MRLGNVTLHALSDGIQWSDGGGLFGLVPKVLWEQAATPDEQNRVAFQLRCLLVETDKQRILVDTGLGDKLSDKEREQNNLIGEQRLLASLEAVGIGSMDVDLVINTHLHNDHCGGNTRYGEDGEQAPTFPRAIYCVQRLELADAAFPNERTQATYRPENWEPLQRTGQLRILSGDTRLSDEVSVMVTPGHTRAHQCVLIESEGHKGLFMGDLASWPIHMERLAWVPAYDVEPLISIETKRRIALWAVENRALLIFEHHPDVIAGYLYSTERSDRFRLAPVDFT
jgi:glyoxylase-like metal-dependent hydrolase (beta-lactamase superfamily II)